MLQEARGDVDSHPAYRRYHYAYGPLSVTDAAGTRFIGTDALGSPTDLTTTTGTVAAAHQYDAWGQYRNGTAPSAEEPKLGYTGHQYDPETGLVYARARYYDPEIGIFISRDTLEGTYSDAPSLHRFAYVKNNPLIFTDPTGHQFATSCDTPGGAPACAIAMGEAGAGTAATSTATATSAAGATTTTATGAAGATTTTATGAAGATTSTAVGEGVAAVPWYKAILISAATLFTRDNKPYSEWTPEEKRKFEEEAGRQFEKDLDETLAKAKVVLEGGDGRTVRVPISEPGKAKPIRAPGHEGQKGTVVTDPSAGETRSAPGSRGTGLPMADPPRADKQVHAAPNVNWGQQEKHIPGTNNFIPGRSTVTTDPDKLAEQAGTGQQVGNVPVGQPGSKERVDFGKVIGSYVDPVTGTSVPTTKGIIHYGKNGIHVVPARP